MPQAGWNYKGFFFFLKFLLILGKETSSSIPRPNFYGNGAFTFSSIKMSLSISQEHSLDIKTCRQGYDFSISETGGIINALPCMIFFSHIF